MWLIDYEEDGKRRRVSTGIKTAPMKNPPADVKSVGRDIVLGLRTPAVPVVSSAGQARKQDGRLTVSDLLDKCEKTIWHADNVRSQRTIRSNVKILNEYLGSEAVADMTYTRIEQLITDMKAKGYQPATILRKLAMLKRALKQAVVWDLLTAAPPTPRIVVRNLKERVITPEEETAIWVALEKRRQLEPNRQWFAFRVFLTVVFDTGGRLSEVLGLSPEHLQQQAQRTYLTFPRYRTKSGKPRTLPLADRSVSALGSLMDHLTRDKATGEFRFFGFTPQTADKMFRTIRTDVMTETGLDIADVGIHTIRHTVLTRLARGGMELARLQKWAGHSDPKITAERYLHLMPSDLDAGLDILGTVGGTDRTIKERNRTGPVIVSVPNSGAIGASPGTGRLQ
jgi:integrase